MTSPSSTSGTDASGGVKRTLSRVPIAAGVVVRTKMPVALMSVMPAHTHTLTLPEGVKAARYQVGKKATFRGTDGAAAYECDVQAAQGQALQLTCTGPDVGAGANVIVPR